MERKRANEVLNYWQIRLYSRDSEQMFSYNSAVTGTCNYLKSLIKKERYP